MVKKKEIFNYHFDVKICPKVSTALMVGLQYQTSFLIEMVIIYLILFLYHLLDCKIVSDRFCILFRTKDLPSFINNRLSSRSGECTAARFKYPANRPDGGGEILSPPPCCKLSARILLSAHCLSGRVSLDSVFCVTFLRIKWPSFAIFSFNLDLVTCYLSFLFFLPPFSS